MSDDLDDDVLGFAVKDFAVRGNSKRDNGQNMESRQEPVEGVSYGHMEGDKTEVSRSILSFFLISLHESE